MELAAVHIQFIHCASHAPLFTQIWLVAASILSKSPVSRCGSDMNGTVAAGRSHMFPSPVPLSSSSACCSSRMGR